MKPGRPGIQNRRMFIIRVCLGIRFTDERVERIKKVEPVYLKAVQCEEPFVARSLVKC